MSDDYLQELKTACGKSDKSTDREIIEIGETILLAGRAAPASEATIALEVGNGRTVVIKEEDVVDVEKEGSDYLVRVKMGTDVLVRFEQVSQLSPTAAACACSDVPSDRPHSEVPKRSGGPHSLSRTGFFEGMRGEPVCWIRWDCRWISKPPYVICVPIVECPRPYFPPIVPPPP
jgi:hypothetical protein